MVVHQNQEYMKKWMMFFLAADALSLGMSRIPPGGVPPRFKFKTVIIEFRTNQKSEICR
jgi:hypothetical protein